MPTRALDVLETQAFLAKWVTTSECREWGTNYPPAELKHREIVTGQTPEETWADCCKWMRRGLLSAPTYWISHDMADLVWTSSPTFPPDATITAPSETGFALFDKPGTIHPDYPEADHVRLRGVHWDTDVFSWWCSYVNGSGDLRPTFPMPLNAPPATIRSLMTEGMIAGFGAMCALLRQRIAVRVTHMADRATRRRIDRLGADLSEVQVVTLRRPRSETHTSEHQIPVDWSHRWLVDGHWRNHYYPAADEHHAIWIAPHVKGPDHKPLVIRPRVYRWSR